MKKRERSKPLRILLIENDEVDRSAFIQAFESSQISSEITVCDSARDALEMLHGDSSLFNMVVTDFILPDMSGLDICKKIADEGIDLPLVIMVNAGSEEVVTEALRIGVDDYIIKGGDGGYLKLLPPTLNEVSKRHNSRLARKKAEEALEESENRYRFLTDNIIENIFKADMDLNITFVTGSSVHTIGYTPEEMTGKKIWEFCSDDDRGKIEEMIAAGLSEKPSHTRKTFTIKLIHKDGREIPSEVNAGILYDGDGKPTGIQGSVRDITEQKIAEEALKESEKRYRMLVEESDDFIYTSDFEGNFKYVSSAAERIMGLHREKLKGRNFTEVMTPESQKRASELIKRQLNKEDVGIFEMEFYDRDGNVVTVETREKWEWENDKVAEVHGICRNITDRKRAEKALVESEEKFRLAAKSTGDLIYELDVPTGDLDWCGDIDAVLGYKKGKFKRTLDAWIESIHPDDAKLFKNTIKSQLKKEGSFSVECRIRRKDGSWRYWINRGTTMVNDLRKPVKLVGACTDVTERRLAVEALRKSELQLKTILSSSNVG